MVRFIVQAFDACRAEVLAFRNANRSESREPAYVDWRYRRPCERTPLIVWGVDESGRRLATLSIVPHDFFVHDRIQTLGEIGDISVLPDCRGQGVGTRMIEFIGSDPQVSASLSGLLVLPNDEAAGAFRRAQWSEKARIRRHIRIVDVGSRLRRHLGGSKAVGLLSNVGNTLLKWQAGARTSPPDAQAKLIDTVGFKSEYDVFWEALSKRGRILSMRDAAYLNWRYAEHPLLSYRLFELRSHGALQAYAVFHVVDEVAVVEEYLATDALAGARLVSELVSVVRETGVASCIQVAFADDGAFGVPWARHGFFRRDDFQPVLVHAGREGAALLRFPGENWFVTAGDKDV